MVLKPGTEAAAEKIFQKWELDFAIVGETTDTGRLIITHNGEAMADMPVATLADSAPEYQRPHTPTPAAPVIAASDVPAPESILGSLEAMLASQHLCSRRWIWEQYDHMVMGDTVQRPGGDAGVVRIHGTTKGIAITTDVTPRYCEADPVEGGKQAVAETYRNLCAVGADPLAITDCMNFGNPERPEIMGQFVGCIEGMGEACKALGTPVVSGNVSLYNETNGVAIPPTPAIGGVGLIPNIDRMAFTGSINEGDDLWLVGETHGHLGQSIYQDVCADGFDGAPPAVDLEAERANGEKIRKLIRANHVTAVHDISDGGLLVAIAELAMASGIGFDLNEAPDTMPAHAWWFGEDQARYIVTAASGTPVPGALKLGTAGGESLAIAGATTTVVALQSAHEAWLPDYMG